MKYVFAPIFFLNLFFFGSVFLTPRIVDAALSGSSQTTLSVTVNGEVEPEPETPPPSGGGGGGGGGGVSSPTGITFSGRAYPLSRVTILKNGQAAVTTIAGPDAKFNVSLANLSTGNYTFSVYGEDSDGRRSESFTFPVYVTSGASTNVSGIFIAPTIAVDKSQVRRGDNIAIFGQSTPSGEITIEVNSDTTHFVKTTADGNGVYLFNFDSTPLEIGQHLAKSKAAIVGEVSVFGRPVVFAVGNKNITPKEDQKCPLKADLNRDCRVNLVDFSIAAFWYKRSSSTAFRLLEKDYLSGDGQVDLRDFSIMAYHWTG